MPAISPDVLEIPGVAEFTAFTQQKIDETNLLIDQARAATRDRTTQEKSAASSRAQSPLKKLTLPYVEDVAELPVKAQGQVVCLHAFTEALIESHYRTQEELGRHINENAALKGEKKRPQFKPSRMNEDAGKVAPAAPDADAAADAAAAKHPGSAKVSKTTDLAIEHTCVIAPTETIPPGSRFKGYRDVVVQDLVVRARNTRYRLACCQTPDGRRLTGQLPSGLNLRRTAPMSTLNVNGRQHAVDAAPRPPSCGHCATRWAQPAPSSAAARRCAAPAPCTVHLDGQAIRSCVTPISAAAGKKITTIEAATDGGDRVGAAVHAAWVKHDVAQCDYCQSGQIMSATAFLKSLPRGKQPSAAEIESAMSGNICRCGTYVRIRAAIADADAARTLA